MIKNFQIRRPKEWIINKTLDTLMMTGTEILSIANMYETPIKTGRLQNSAWVQRLSKNENEVSVELSYGKPKGLRGENPYINALRVAEPIGTDGISKERGSYGALTYAIEVHETDMQYNYGRKFRYLADPVRTETESIFFTSVLRCFRD
jgi:hypothetical protein